MASKRSSCSHTVQLYRPCVTELPSKVLDAVTCTDPVDPTLLKRYQSLLGGLLYAATNTRPDIAYAVGLLCRAMSKPSEELFAAALRVLSYLHMQKHIGLSTMLRSLQLIS